MFLIILLYAFIHPIYISTASINFNDQKLEIKFKLFRDDLEDAIREKEGISIPIDSQIKLKKNIIHVNNYINDSFKLLINSRSINFNINHYLIKNDVIELVVNKTYTEKILKIKIINELLIDVYKTQRNILLLDIEEKKFYYNFSSSRIEQLFVIG